MIILKKREKFKMNEKINWHASSTKRASLETGAPFLVLINCC